MNIENLASGIYAECDLTKFREPLEAFCFDPVLPATSGMDLNPVGVQLVEFDTEINRRQISTSHLVDWLSAIEYPNVADFLEEVRAQKLVRRPLPIDLEFGRLTRYSRIFFIHGRALIANAAEYKSVYRDTACPKGNMHSENEPCAALWWRDVVSPTPHDGPPVSFGRDFRGTKYTVWERPPHVIPDYRLGFVASFPIRQLLVVQPHDSRMYSAAYEAGIPVVMV